MLKHVLITLTIVLLAGCTTTGGSGDGTASPVADASAPVTVRPPVWPKVDFASPSTNLLDVTAKLGAQYDIGVSLMQGIGLRPVAPMEHRGVRFPSLVDDLARETGCLVETTPYYLFVYPPGYEDLLRLNLYDRLPNVWRDRALSVSFDGNRKLGAVLAFLSDALETTIVADNLVAEANIGLVRLPYAPVPDVLNAVLKSARVVPEAFDISAGDDYIFLHRRGTAGLATAYLGETDPILAQRVTLTLPEGSANGGRFRPVEGATELGALLGTLSRQAGVRITAGQSLQALPVNQTVIRNLPLQTALDLIVRQWPVDTIRYRLVDGGIHFDRIR